MQISVLMLTRSLLQTFVIGRRFGKRQDRFVQVRELDEWVEYFSDQSTLAVQS